MNKLQLFYLWIKTNKCVNLASINTIATVQLSSNNEPDTDHVKQQQQDINI